MIAPEKDSVSVCSACGAEMAGDITSCFLCGHARRNPPLKKGQVIAGRYELTGVLGRGGMGTVYAAHDRSLDERVALKVLAETAEGSADADRRFRSEIKLARKIRHPNVCAIHEYGELQEMQYIVMEFVDGQDLKKYLASQGMLTPSEASEIARQIGEGLQAIHDAGVVHRDLKLANVMRDATGRLRLMDFGIAKNLTDSTATATGLIIGTPEYMSPEQARGERVDYRSDVYALAIVTHELFTGRVPFKADTPLGTIMLQVHEPPALSDPRIPRSLVPVLRKALAKEPAGRYGSVRAFLDAMASTAGTAAPATANQREPEEPEGPELTAALTDSLRPPKRRLWWVGVAAATLAWLGAMAWVGGVIADFFSGPSTTASVARSSPSPLTGNTPETTPTALANAATPSSPPPTPLAQVGASTPRATPAPTRVASSSLPSKATATTPLPNPATERPRSQAITRPLDPTPDPPSFPTPGSAGEPVRSATPLPTARLSVTPTQQESVPAGLTPLSTPAPTVAESVAPIAAPARAAAPALLVLSVKPRAEITLDGQVLGETTAYTAIVAPGRHVVVFKHKNWLPLTRTVSVVSGDRLQITIDLKDEGILKSK